MNNLNLKELKVEDLNFRIKTSEAVGQKVLQLNGFPLPRTIDKTDDFYVGYVEGFKRAMLMINNPRR